MIITLKPASRFIAWALLALIVLLGGFSIPQSVSHAAVSETDGTATNLAEPDPTPREAELLARVAQLEAMLDQATAENKQLAAKLLQQQMTNARLTAAMEIVTRQVEAKDKQIEKQSELIKEMNKTFAEVMEQREELSQALIEERAQHRRAKDAVLRLTENLKRCQAERDKLAAELEALREKTK